MTTNRIQRRFAAGWLVTALALPAGTAFAGSRPTPLFELCTVRQDLTAGTGVPVGTDRRPFGLANGFVRRGRLDGVSFEGVLDTPSARTESLAGAVPQAPQATEATGPRYGMPFFLFRTVGTCPLEAIHAVPSTERAAKAPTAIPKDPPPGPVVNLRRTDLR